jgi:hypothetical protein
VKKMGKKARFGAVIKQMQAPANPKRLKAQAHKED